jgi:uncharacterized protein (TIGR02246 family)
MRDHCVELKQGGASMNDRAHRGVSVPAMVAVTLASGVLAGPALAATKEEIIRALEQQQVQAALAGDAATLTTLFAPDLRIINPTGVIGTGDQLLKLLTGGRHPYRSARYETQLVRDLGNVVVTVGMEDVVPNQGPQAGIVVHRRVTQVWKLEQGHWLLTLRHAMVVQQPGT